MTISEAISLIDTLRPNLRSGAEKCAWLYELDSKTSLQVYRSTPPEPYNVLTDGAKKLLIDSPYDDLYVLYLITKLDFFDGEYARYTNDATVFNSEFSDFAKNWRRDHRPARKKIRVVGV